MLNIRYENSFKKDYKRIVKRGYDTKLLETVLELLCSQSVLPERYRDHPLKGNYTGYRELHILPDWLLIYKIQETELTLVLTRTGSHSDLFF